MTLLSLTASAQSEPYAVLSDGGQTVTFYYDSNKATRGGIDIYCSNGIISGGASSPYGTASTAVIDASFADYRPTSTDSWFMYCSALTNIIGMENLNTDNVKNMGAMFYNCSSLTRLNVSGFDTSNVESMAYMFGNCSGLTSLDVSSFNTSNVTDMGGMFSGCSGLTSLDLSGFDTSNVLYMVGMFYGCSSLTSLDLSGFNTSNVIYMSDMFRGCSNLTTIYAGDDWSTASVTWSSFMFEVCTSLVGGNGTVFDVKHTDAEYARIDKPGQPGYFTASSSGIAIDKTNFPDDNFRSRVLAQDYGQDGVLTDEEIAAVTEINVISENISNLKGIEYFTALEVLHCESNQLTSLDVSKNTALTGLYCNWNQLTSLDVSKNTALTKLECYGNQLTSLDVSKNSALTELYCYWNQLTMLDVSGCTALTELWCMDNKLSSLNVSKNTALIVLYCYNNKLTSLDVSKNAVLERLWCRYNQLTSLDVSQNTALTSLVCQGNQLTTLDVSKNVALTELYCQDNQLTTLGVSNNLSLTVLSCFSNRIKVTEMGKLVESLPTVGDGKLYVKYFKDNNDQNVITTLQVIAAKKKGWTVYATDTNGKWIEYEGSDEQTISPVDEGEVINIGNEIDENTNLDGNVVDNVYFNINDGSYDATGGCIVVNSPTDDSFINGQDIFGDDFKEGYNGIVFMVPAGEGTINVEAETTGDMVLKVKIGNKKPITMVLNGKLTISFPYDVTEDTYVYIYGGTNSAGAKGMKKASGSGSLKIYGIEVVGGENGIEAIDNGQLTIDNSPMYNLNGQRVISSPSGRPGGVPTKGVFIKNGKKVLVK